MERRPDRKPRIVSPMKPPIEFFAAGGLASAIESLSGADSGDTQSSALPSRTCTDLPGPRFFFFFFFTELAIKRLSASPADIETAGLTSDAASKLFNDHLRQQVLDYLDTTYTFSIAPALVDREFASIHRLAESQLDPGMGDKEALRRVPLRPSFA